PTRDGGYIEDHGNHVVKYRKDGTKEYMQSGARTVQYRKESSDVWCACHNGVYDTAGRNVSGPPPRPLTTFAVHVRGEEIVVTRQQKS
ncbi:MAG: Rieske 2Fe-2S domain-containing protein, partial [Acidobacteria bacterium]|nr:Rieske 2Fe-2S domain-containing protein [Acidobacteriota bacterium]